MENEVKLNDVRTKIYDCMESIRSNAGKLSNISYDLRDHGIDEEARKYGEMLKIAVDVIIMAAVDIDSLVLRNIDKHF